MNSSPHPATPLYIYVHRRPWAYLFLSLISIIVQASLLCFFVSSLRSRLVSLSLCYSTSFIVFCFLSCLFFVRRITIFSSSAFPVFAVPTLSPSVVARSEYRRGSHYVYYDSQVFLFSLAGYFFCEVPPFFRRSSFAAGNGINVYIGINIYIERESNNTIYSHICLFPSVSFRNNLCVRECGSFFVVVLESGEKADWCAALWPPVPQRPARC